ncbi:signal peptidase complex subunit 2 [Acrasis kona]|uniref:Signal peptidase complex subunit 2 n=1 Tax=Acrasis kona TaxID=1008807 RepID=A0AAW2YHS6_9EUKA
MSKRPAKKQSEEVTTVQEEIKLLQPELVPEKKGLFNVYDVNTLKYTLDTEVIRTIKDEQLFQVDNTISTLKISLGFIACSCAVIAYFCTDKMTILALCGIYFFCGGIISLCSYFLEKNAILLTKPLNNHVLRVTSELKAPSYSITVYPVTPVNGGLIFRYRQPTTRDFKKTWKVNDLFDERGAIDKVQLAKDINQLIKL